MKIYRVLFEIPLTEPMQWRSFAVDSKEDVVNVLKKELEEKYNPETIKLLIITKIERI